MEQEWIIKGIQFIMRPMSLKSEIGRLPAHSRKTNHKFLGGSDQYAVDILTTLDYDTQLVLGD
jgi:hypothetical protein